MDSVQKVDPSTIYFTFSRIRPCFSCGRTIESTLGQMQRKELSPTDLPLLCVFRDQDGNLFSQNNRRLYMYKQLQSQSLISTIPVRIRPLPSTKRMAQKYTPEKCSMTATLMRETKGNDRSTENNTNLSGGEHETEDDNEDDEVSRTPAASSQRVDGFPSKKEQLAEPEARVGPMPRSRGGRKAAAPKSKPSARAPAGGLSLEEELKLLGLNSE